MSHPSVCMNARMLACICRAEHTQVRLIDEKKHSLRGVGQQIKSSKKLQHALHDGNHIVTTKDLHRATDEIAQEHPVAGVGIRASRMLAPVLLVALAAAELCMVHT